MTEPKADVQVYQIRKYLPFSYILFFLQESTAFFIYIFSHCTLLQLRTGFLPLTSAREEFKLLYSPCNKDRDLVFMISTSCNHFPGCYVLALSLSSLSLYCYPCLNCTVKCSVQGVAVNYYFSLNVWDASMCWENGIRTNVNLSRLFVRKGWYQSDSHCCSGWERT